MLKTIYSFDYHKGIVYIFIGLVLLFAISLFSVFEKYLDMDKYKKTNIELKTKVNNLKDFNSLKLKVVKNVR